MKTLFSVLVALSCLSTLYSQGWMRSYNFFSKSSHVADAIKVNDSCIAIVGQLSDDIDQPSGLLSLINTSGQVIWVKEFFESGHVVDFNSLQKTSDGGYIVVGELRYNGSFGYTGLVIKIDNNGNTIWRKEFYPNGANLYKVGVTATNDYVVFGERVVSTNPYLLAEDMVFMLNSTGEMIWSKAVNSKYIESDKKSLLVLPDGASIVVSSKGSLPNWMSDSLYIIKFSVGGQVQWKTEYKFNLPSEIIMTHDSDFTVIGSTSNNSYASLYLLKTNLSGQFMWDKKMDFDSLYNYYGVSICQTSEGECVIFGTHTSPNNRFNIQKMNKNGLIEWERFYADGDCWAKKIIPINDGYILIGNSHNLDTDSILIIKTNLDGDTTNTVLPVELTIFSGTYFNNSIILNWHTATEVNNYGFDIERQDNSDWYHVKFINGHGNSNSPKEYQYTDRDYSKKSNFVQYRLVQIDIGGKKTYHQIINVKTSTTFLLSCYPNPFNSSTIINLPSLGGTLKIYNQLGQEVDMVNVAENDNVSYNAKKLSSGVYFISHISKVGETKTIKAMVLK